MINRWMAEFFLVAACFLFTYPSLATDLELDGRWVGKMRQVNTEGEDSYPISLQLIGEVGRTAYPSLNCGGSLRRLATVNGQNIYIETITHGRVDPKSNEGCFDGFIVVQVYRSTLVLEWSGSYLGEPYVATAILKKRKIPHRDKGAGDGRR